VIAEQDAALPRGSEVIGIRKAIVKLDLEKA
jgi:hypothetical protein